jgi:RND family efflux transporter MFP subunit
MRQMIHHGLLTSVGIILLAGAGCHQDAAPAAAPKAPKVTVSHPTFKQIRDENSYTGWLRASATVDVRARVKGHIKKVHFEDGDLVKKDQLLFELDPRPFQTAIDQADAQAKAIAAQVVALQKDVARYTDLVKTRAVTQQQLDKAIADVGYADAQHTAMLEQVKAAQLELEYSKITAPIAGQIGRALLTEGNFVNAGGTDPVLATINAVDPISIYFSVDEQALQEFVRAQRSGADKNGGSDNTPLRDKKYPIQFGLDTDEGYPHQALLDFANNEIDASTGTIEVRAKSTNAGDKLKPGYRVRVRIPVSAPYDAILVPEAAINTDQDKKYLLLVDEKGNAKRRDVELGRLLDDGMQVILSSKPPLEKNTQIIVEGMQRARLNYPVEAISEPAPTQTAAR